MNTSLDTSHELTLHRHLNGVQLRRPTHESHDPSIRDILKKRMIVFIKSPDHVFQMVNDQQLKFINAGSHLDVVGKNFFDLIGNTQKNHIIMHNNIEVIKNRKAAFFNEEIEFAHLTTEVSANLPTKAMCVKMPLFGLNNEVLGLFGFAHPMQTACTTSNPNEFAEAINLFFATSTETNNDPQPTTPPMELPYSPREREVIKHILRGKTINETAQLMNLSTRTAEHYFANIKTKAGVKSRSALIETLWNQGFQNR